MSKKIIIGFLFLLSTQLQGQHTLKLMDSITNEALAFTNVVFYKGQDTLSLQSNRDGEINCTKHFTTEDQLFFEVTSHFYSHQKTVWKQTELSKLALVSPKEEWLNPVVVTGEYNPNSVENSVHTIKVIDAKRIEAQGAVNLKDVLVNETNIQLSQDGILGSSMAMQGISGQNIKIMIDGVPVIGRLDGSIDISQINLDNIARIEIVEGPLSVNYGTDALGGTINLISKKNGKNKLRVEGNTYYESVGQYNLNGSINYGFKKSNINISGGRNYFDGWSNGEAYTLLPIATLADTSRTKTWKPKEQYFGKVKYQYKTKKWLLSPYLDYFQEEITNRGYPRKPYYQTAFDETYKTYRFNQGLYFKGELGKYFTVEGVAAHNNFRREKNTWVKDLTSLEQELSENETAQDTSVYDTYMSRSTFVYHKDSALVNYQFGYDVNYETAKGRRVIAGVQDYADIALFGSVQVNLGKHVIVKPGLRVIYNTAYDAPLVPSLNVKWDVKSVTFRGSYARGFRAPSLKELYYEFVDINHNILGNSELLAESSNNFQLNGAYKKVFKKQVLKIKVGTYYNRITDQITLALNGETQNYSYVNIDELTTKGINTNWSLQLDGLTINAGATYNGVLYNLNAETVNLSEFIFNTEVNGSIQYKIPKTGVSANVFYKYTGESTAIYLDENENVLEGVTQSFNTMDFSLTRAFWQKRINLSVGAKNIFDVSNITSTTSLGGVHSGGSGSVLKAWGRSYFVSLKFNFTK